MRHPLNNPALRLTLFAAIALGAISITSVFTRDRIIRNEADWERRGLLKALGQSQYDNRPHRERLSGIERRRAPYMARYKGNITALVWPTITENGYNGEIKLLVALDIVGSILGIVVTAHKETPGLGDLIEADKSDWLLGLIGRGGTERLALSADGGDIDAITSATITSRAVIAAIANTLAKQAAQCRQRNPDLVGCDQQPEADEDAGT